MNTYETLHAAFITAGFSDAAAGAKAKEILAGLDADRERAESGARLIAGITVPMTALTLKGERCTYIATGRESAAHGKKGRTVNGWKIGLYDAENKIVTTIYSEDAMYIMRRIAALNAEKDRLLSGGHDADTTFTVVKRAD